MARLVKVQNGEEQLQVKKKLRHLVTYDKTIKLIQIICLIYICYKISV